VRIFITADLHYDVARSKGPTEAIAEEICRKGADILLIVGDCVSTDLAMLDRMLGLFDGFRGPKLLVAGNHELWTCGGADSLHRYEVELLEACRRCGVHYLDDAPFRADGVAFVGSVGWYDYSFRPASLGIPLRFYQSKVAPGAAGQFTMHRHLLEPADDISAAGREVTTRWMDGVRVSLPMDDTAFTERLVAKLRRHLDEVHESAQHVVAAVHHLPFHELVPHSLIPNWAFANAFMGSELFGEVLTEYPKNRHVYCGHSHQLKKCRRRDLECISVGSTYRDKRYEVLEL
jgi:predicted phosphohydrolase